VGNSLKHLAWINLGKVNRLNIRKKRYFVIKQCGYCALSRVFIDGSYHGEMKANSAADADGYQYSVDDLNPGQTYDVAVKVCD